MTDQAAMIWKCSVANVRKLTPNTTGSGSEKRTNGASLNIVRLPGDSSREVFSSRCMRAQWLLGQTLSTATLVPNSNRSRCFIDIALFSRHGPKATRNRSDRALSTARRLIKDKLFLLDL